MLSFLLNLPYTILGLLIAIVSFPTDFRVNQRPFALIISVKSLWWSFHKGTRASTVGYIVLLGPKEETNDLEHELIHVQQYKRLPFIFPFLYLFELLKNGYRKNKYEEEAYFLAKNIYRE